MYNNNRLNLSVEAEIDFMLRQRLAHICFENNRNLLVEWVSVGGYLKILGMRVGYTRMKIWYRREEDIEETHRTLMSKYNFISQNKDYNM